MRNVKKQTPFRPLIMSDYNVTICKSHVAYFDLGNIEFPSENMERNGTLSGRNSEP